MTFPVLNNAAEVILCLAGFEKASMVTEVLERTAHAPQYPVQMVQPNNGIKRWMLDKAAAKRHTAGQTNDTRLQITMRSKKMRILSVIRQQERA